MEWPWIVAAYIMIGIVIIVAVVWHDGRYRIEDIFPSIIMTLMWPAFLIFLALENLRWNGNKVIWERKYDTGTED